MGAGSGGAMVVAAPMGAGSGGAMAVAALVLAAFVSGKAVRDAIVLATFDVTLLPALFGISAALSLPFVVIAGRLMRRWGPRRLVAGLDLASAALLVVESVLFGPLPRVAAVACFLHLSIAGGVLVSGFWSVVNESFDARAGKRHVARIGFGATLGGIAGGVIAERAGAYLRVEALLVIVAAMQAIAGAAVLRLGRGAGAADAGAGAGAGVAPAVEAAASGEAREGLARTAAQPLLRRLGGLLVLGAVAAAILDYAFKAHLAATLESGALLRTLGMYYTAVNVLTAVVQLLLSRAVVAHLGVARALSTLPGVTALAAVLAWLAPGTGFIVGARGGEMVMRSSVFRAAYELVYAPLPEAEKRSAKVVLDVGAERVGDLIGSQVVALLVWSAVAPSIFAAGAAVVAGLALVVALRIPAAYKAALEARLAAQPGGFESGELRAATLADTGDLTTLSLLDLRASPSGRGRSSIERPNTGRASTGHASGAVPAVAAPAAAMAAIETETVQGRALDELLSSDPARVRAALAAGLAQQLAPFVVPLLAWDAVRAEAARALEGMAPAATGVLADALGDESQELAIRRRVPAILAHGEPALAAWALARSLADPRFEVRYASARALAHLQEGGAPALPLEQVSALVRAELSKSAAVWRSYRVLDAEPAAATGDAEVVVRRILQRRSDAGLDHVFTLLGLALPARPLRMALQSLVAGDPTARAVALEYLETALPPDLRRLLWPRIAADEVAARPARPARELVDELLLSQPSVAARLVRLAASDP